MGWFSGSTETYVSSTVYNLAGDIKQRADYLRTTVVSTVLRHGNDYMGETIANAYRNGPGLRFRSFADWSVNSGYNNLVGLSTGSIGNSGSINQTLLANIIGNEEGATIKLVTSNIGYADYTYWSEQYMLQNYPEQFDSNWTAEYFAETGIVYITLVGGTVVEVPLHDFNPDKKYLYASYNVSTGSSEGPINHGPVITLADGQPFPSTAGYSRTSNSNESKTLPINIDIDVVVSYSDGRPNETSHSSSSTVAPYNETHSIWQRVTYNGQSDDGRIVSIRDILNFNQVGTYGANTSNTTTGSEVISGGVIKTTTTTYTSQTLKLVRTYRQDDQELTLDGWSQLKSLIYMQGTGDPDLEAMFNVQDAGTFFPFIPFRENGQFLSGSYFPDIFEKSKTAYRKSTGGRLSQMISKVADNDSIGDIDFGFIVYGVSLNTQEDTCKKYLYKFFKSLMLRDPTTYSAFQTYKTNYSLAQNSQAAFKAWFEAQGNPASPLFGAPQPQAKPYPVMPTFELNHASNRGDLNYNMTVRWSWIRETVTIGKYKAGALKGNAWVEKDGVDVFNQILQWSTGDDVQFTDQTNTSENIKITWQDSDNTYRTIRVGNLKHVNLVYAGKTIDTSAYKALDDAEESCFIVPLHSQTFRDMGIKDMTQMSNAVAYIVFNSYTQVTEKWYQTGVFKIIVIIIIIIIAVYSGGTGAGLLGTNAGVGASLGFTGTAAIVVGAIANAVAAMILFNVLTSASKAIFGERVGAIVGAIATVVASAYGSAYMQGQDMSSVFANMMKADNLIKLTASVGNGVADYMKASVDDTMTATAELLSKYEAEAKKISDAYSENIQNTGVSLDPLAITKATTAALEYPDNFFVRTLMTGSDIAEMQNQLLTQFVSLTLSQNLPI